jgi:hypothetical protein
MSPVAPAPQVPRMSPHVVLPSVDRNLTETTPLAYFYQLIIVYCLLRWPLVPEPAAPSHRQGHAPGGHVAGGASRGGRVRRAGPPGIWLTLLASRPLRQAPARAAHARAAAGAGEPRSCPSVGSQFNSGAMPSSSAFPCRPCWSSAPVAGEAGELAPPCAAGIARDRDQGAVAEADTARVEPAREPLLHDREQAHSRRQPPVVLRLTTPGRKGFTVCSRPVASAAIAVEPKSDVTPQLPTGEAITCRARSSSVAWAWSASSSRFGPATSDASFRPPRAPLRYPSLAHPSEHGPLSRPFSLFRTTLPAALASPGSALSRFQQQATDELNCAARHRAEPELRHYKP